MLSVHLTEWVNVVVHLHAYINILLFISFNKRFLSISETLYLRGYSCSPYLSICKCSIYIFADDWIRTVDLWNRKRPVYQLSHNHCPHLFVWLTHSGQLHVTIASRYKRSFYFLIGFLIIASYYLNCFILGRCEQCQKWFQKWWVWEDFWQLKMGR